MMSFFHSGIWSDPYNLSTRFMPCRAIGEVDTPQYPLIDEGGGIDEGLALFSGDQLGPGIFFLGNLRGVGRRCRDVRDHVEIDGA